MFTDQQFDRYNQAVSDMRKLQVPGPIANIVEAFNRSLKLAPEIIKQDLSQADAEAWRAIAILLWDGVVYTLKVQAAFVVVVGTIGAAATFECPIVGAAGGATVGWYLSAWYLAAIGLGAVTAMVGQVAGFASVEFEQGAREAAGGNVDLGAKLMAAGLAKIIELTCAIAILACFVKGGQLVLKKINPQQLGSQLLNRLGGLPGSIKNFKAWVQNSRWGYAFSEIQAMKDMSRNGSLYVIRACNPARLAVGKGRPLPGKGLEIKGKSFKGGIHEGKVGVDVDDVAKLKTKYDFEPLPRDSGYRLKLKQGKTGELDNHILEKADYVAHGPDECKMVLLDSTGRPYIPDMDRLVCMEVNVAAQSGKSANISLRDKARFGDDPEEVAAFNLELNRRLGDKRVNTDAAKHGYTSSNIKPDGKPIWHANENETLLVFVDTLFFEMTWNEFVLFCQANKKLNMPQCFRMIE